MNYSNSDMIPGLKHEFAAEIAGNLHEDWSYNRNGEFLTGILAPDPDKKKDKLTDLIDKSFQDDCYNDQAREKLFKSSINKQAEYVYTISYNRAVGSISRNSEFSIFQGSSFNRKEKIKSNPKGIQTEAPAVDGSNDEAATKLQQALRMLGQTKNIHKGSRLGGKAISKRTKDKIKEKMLAMFAACKGRKGFRSDKVDFTFLTLTFISRTTDRKATGVLNKFLTVVRKKYGSFGYIWVAEKQGNGNIHFHMVLDRRLPIHWINAIWVKQQLESNIKNDHIELECKETEGQSIEELFYAGKFSTIQKYLNPADIKRIKTIEGVSCYLTNYVTKNKSEMFGCAGWHCNRQVSRIFTKQIIDRNTFDVTSDSSINRITNLKKKQFINTTYVGQYCIINSIYNKSYYRRYLLEMENINRIIMNVERSERIDKELINSNNKIDKYSFIKQFANRINLN